MFKILKNLTKKNEELNTKGIAKCPKCGGKIFENNDFWACENLLTGNCNFRMSSILDGEKIDIDILIACQYIEEFEYINSMLNNQAQKEKIKRDNNEFKNDIKLDVRCGNCSHDIYKVKDKIKCNNKDCNFEIATVFKGVEFSDEQMIELIHRRVSEVYKFENGKTGRVLIPENKESNLISNYLFFDDVSKLNKKYQDYYFMPKSLNKNFSAVKYLLNQ